jgi:hypothetical protein
MSEHPHEYTPEQWDEEVATWDIDLGTLRAENVRARFEAITAEAAKWRAIAVALAGWKFHIERGGHEEGKVQYWIHSLTHHHPGFYDSEEAAMEAWFVWSQHTGKERE